MRATITDCCEWEAPGHCEATVHDRSTEPPSNAHAEVNDYDGSTTRSRWRQYRDRWPVYPGAAEATPPPALGSYAQDVHGRTSSAPTDGANVASVWIARGHSRASATLDMYAHALWSNPYDWLQC